MKKIREFAIETKGNRVAYVPGDILQGELYICFEEPVELQCLKIFLYGEAGGQWLAEAESKGNSSRSRVLVDIGLLVFGFTTEDGRTESHERGRFVYDFEFNIPYNLPSTFKSPPDRDLGFARYCLKAVLQRPKKRDKIKKATIVINELIDPSRPDLVYPPGSSQNKNVRTALMPSGTLALESYLNSRQYVQGSSILINATAENKSTKVMKDVYAKLIRRVKCKSRCGVNTYTSDTTSVHEGRIQPHGSVEWKKKELRIPAVGPSVSNNENIRVDYIVRVGMYEELGSEIHLDLPVTIGTMANPEGKERIEEIDADVYDREKKKYGMQLIKAEERDQFRNALMTRVDGGYQGDGRVSRGQNLDHGMMNGGMNQGDGRMSRGMNQEKGMQGNEMISEGDVRYNGRNGGMGSGQAINVHAMPVEEEMRAFEEQQQFTSADNDYLALLDGLPDQEAFHKKRNRSNSAEKHSARGEKRAIGESTEVADASGQLYASNEKLSRSLEEPHAKRRSNSSCGKRSINRNPAVRRIIGYPAKSKSTGALNNVNANGMEQQWGGSHGQLANAGQSNGMSFGINANTPYFEVQNGSREKMSYEMSAQDDTAAQGGYDDEKMMYATQENENYNENTYEESNQRAYERSNENLACNVKETAINLNESAEGEWKDARDSEGEPFTTPPQGRYPGAETPIVARQQQDEYTEVDEEAFFKKLDDHQNGSQDVVYPSNYDVQSHKVEKELGKQIDTYELASELIKDAFLVDDNAVQANERSQDDKPQSRLVDVRKISEDEDGPSTRKQETRSDASRKNSRQSEHQRPMSRQADRSKSRQGDESNERPASRQKEDEEWKIMGFLGKIFGKSQDTSNDATQESKSEVIPEQPTEEKEESPSYNTLEVMDSRRVEEDDEEEVREERMEEVEAQGEDEEEYFKKLDDDYHQQDDTQRYKEQNIQEERDLEMEDSQQHQGDIRRASYQSRGTDPVVFDDYQNQSQELQEVQVKVGRERSDSITQTYNNESQKTNEGKSQNRQYQERPSAECRKPTIDARRAKEIEQMYMVSSNDQPVRKPIYTAGGEEAASTAEVSYERSGENKGRVGNTDNKRRSSNYENDRSVNNQRRNYEKDTSVDNQRRSTNGSISPSSMPGNLRRKTRPEKPMYDQNGRRIRPNKTNQRKPVYKSELKSNYLPSERPIKNNYIPKAQPIRHSTPDKLLEDSETLQVTSLSAPRRPRSRANRSYLVPDKDSLEEIQISRQKLRTRAVTKPRIAFGKIVKEQSKEQRPMTVIERQKKFAEGLAASRQKKRATRKPVESSAPDNTQQNTAGKTTSKYRPVASARPTPKPTPVTKSRPVTSTRNVTSTKLSKKPSFSSGRVSPKTRSGRISPRSRSGRMSPKGRSGRVSPSGKVPAKNRPKSTVKAVPTKQPRKIVVPQATVDYQKLETPEIPQMDLSHPSLGTAVEKHIADGDIFSESEPALSPKVEQETMSAPPTAEPKKSSKKKATKAPASQSRALSAPVNRVPVQSRSVKEIPKRKPVKQAKKPIQKATPVINKTSISSKKKAPRADVVSNKIRSSNYGKSTTYSKGSTACKSTKKAKKEDDEGYETIGRKATDNLSDIVNDFERSFAGKLTADKPAVYSWIPMDDKKNAYDGGQQAKQNTETDVKKFNVVDFPEDRFWNSQTTPARTTDQNNSYSANRNWHREGCRDMDKDWQKADLKTDIEGRSYMEIEGIREVDLSKGYAERVNDERLYQDNRNQQVGYPDNWHRGEWKPTVPGEVIMVQGQWHKPIEGNVMPQHIVRNEVMREPIERDQIIRPPYEVIRQPYWHQDACISPQQIASEERCRHEWYRIQSTAAGRDDRWKQAVRQQPSEVETTATEPRVNYQASIQPYSSYSTEEKYRNHQQQPQSLAQRVHQQAYNPEIRYNPSKEDYHQSFCTEGSQENKQPIVNQPIMATKESRSFQYCTERTTASEKAQELTSYQKPYSRDSRTSKFNIEWSKIPVPVNYSTKDWHKTNCRWAKKTEEVAEERVVGAVEKTVETTQYCAKEVEVNEKKSLQEEWEKTKEIELNRDTPTDLERKEEMEVKETSVEELDDTLEEQGKKSGKSKKGILKKKNKRKDNRVLPVLPKRKRSQEAKSNVFFEPYESRESPSPIYRDYLGPIPSYVGYIERLDESLMNSRETLSTSKDETKAVEETVKEEKVEDLKLPASPGHLKLPTSPKDAVSTQDNCNQTSERLYESCVQTSDNVQDNYNQTSDRLYDKSIEITESNSVEVTENANRKDIDTSSELKSQEIQTQTLRNCENPMCRVADIQPVKTIIESPVSEDRRSSPRKEDPLSILRQEELQSPLRTDDAQSQSNKEDSQSPDSRFEERKYMSKEESGSMWDLIQNDDPDFVNDRKTPEPNGDFRRRGRALTPKTFFPAVSPLPTQLSSSIDYRELQRSSSLRDGKKRLSNISRSKSVEPIRTGYRSPLPMYRESNNSYDEKIVVYGGPFNTEGHTKKHRSNKSPKIRREQKILRSSSVDARKESSYSEIYTRRKSIQENTTPQRFSKSESVEELSLPKQPLKHPRTRSEPFQNTWKDDVIRPRVTSHQYTPVEEITMTSTEDDSKEDEEWSQKILQYLNKSKVDTVQQEPLSCGFAREQRSELPGEASYTVESQVVYPKAKSEIPPKSEVLPLAKEGVDSTLKKRTCVYAVPMSGKRLEDSFDQHEKTLGIVDDFGNFKTNQQLIEALDQSVNKRLEEFKRMASTMEESENESLPLEETQVTPRRKEKSE